MTKWPGNLTLYDCQKTQFYAQCTGFESVDKMKMSHICLHSHTERERSYASNRFCLETKSVHTHTVMTRYDNSPTIKKHNEREKNSFRFIYSGLSLSLIAVRKFGVHRFFIYSRFFTHCHAFLWPFRP